MREPAGQHDICHARKPSARRIGARSAVAAVLAAALWLAPTAGAAGHVYSLKLPAGESVTFELNLEPQHPGKLRVHAAWSGQRMLALRLEPPQGEGPVLRRSGQSPLTLEAEVGPVTDSAWRLVIHSLASRSVGEGRLTVELPDPPGSPAKSSEGSTPPPPPPDPWLLPRPTPPDVAAEVATLFHKTEKLRELVTAAVGPDSCRWQDDMLRYLVARSTEAAGGDSGPTGQTRRFLHSVVEAVRLVDDYRTSADPLIAGPPPDEAELQTTWQRLRAAHYQDLEEVLDELLQTSQVDYLSDLREEGWPVRIVSCITACERHFEELGRLGEDRATNRDLTQSQWDTILAAAGALDSLLRIGDEPAIRALRQD